ncbi:cupin domain-containing protein [Hamadaea tsunoensis]|uniref:cupin domain-containing protein n=1 Tax=Hamadaea tsunoensis TaxID=53368 RepID=UPI000402DBAB|nr:cupin domain-containing protein [Hamadaea tsunoensis]
MPYPHEALVVRPGEAEQAPLPHGGRFGLIADADQTSGVFGVNRLTLGTGADGARPHHHAVSAELFYVIDGVAEFQLGAEVPVRVEAGGVVLVPPGLVHAFGAAPRSPVDLLIAVTPGVNRFEYFRTLSRVQRGLEPFEPLLALQEHYDVYFQDPTAWNAVRAGDTLRERA